MGHHFFVGIYSGEDVEKMNHEALAIKAWQKTDSNKREFAEHAALSGQPAANIARAIRDQGGDCSDSQVLKYINAYRLYYRMYLETETEAITVLWEQLPPTYWVRLAELQSRYDIDIQECSEFLYQEWESRTSSRAFAAHVDETYAKTPMWVRKLTKLADDMRGFFLKDYAGEIPPDTRNEIEAVFDETADKLNEIMERANDGTEHQAD